MIRILIISSFFPPNNQTPSERIWSFAKYFHEFDFYPVIVTYDSRISSPELEKAETYEVHRLPVKLTMQERLFEKYKGTAKYPVYLASAMATRLLENVTSRYTGLQPLYDYADTLLRKEKVDWMLISGSPFHLFKFGYLLHQKHNIPWIADYRDDWNTNEVFKADSKGFFKKIVRQFASGQERKWVGTAAFITTVSDHYREKIASFVGRPGLTVLNGFMPENYEATFNRAQKEFRIVYVGSLYETQPIELFISAFLRFCKEVGQAGIKFELLGILEQGATLARIRKLIAGNEQLFELSPRMSKAEAIQRQQNAALLLAVGHLGIKGTPGSKLYEFIALGKPVLLCPGDGDILEYTLQETGQGFVAGGEAECLTLLHQLYNSWKDQGNIPLNGTSQEVRTKYSRKEQVRILAGKIREY